MAEAVTLAHVGRMLSLAEALDATRFEAVVACDPRYRAAVGPVTLPTRDIWSIPAEQFFGALSKGSPIYRAHDLVRYVEDDRALLRSCAPDVVVGDFRLSLAVSARLEGVPYATVTSAYWSPYARIRYTVPDLPLTRLFGVRVAQTVFDTVRPIAFAVHAAPVNRMRRHFDLAPGPRDLRHAYTDADFTLYSDISELVPTAPLPGNHRFIGPVQWAPKVAPPPWWDWIPRDKPIVYLNLGSSGQGRLVPDVLDSLERLPITVIAASAGRVDLPKRANRPFHAEFLPGDQAAQIASLVVCNGGSPSCYQSLAAGRPVVGVPSNMDQFLNMSLVSRSGAGILVRAGRDTPRNVALAVGRMLRTPSYSQRAAAIQTCIQRHHPGETVSALLSQMAAASRAGAN